MAGSFLMTFFLFLRASNDRQLPHTDRVLHAREPRHRRLLTQSRKFEWRAIEKSNECENRAIGESTVEIAPFTWLTAGFGDFMVEHKVQRESRVQEVVGVPELRVEAENNTSEVHRLTLVTPFLLAISRSDASEADFDSEIRMRSVSLQTLQCCLATGVSLSNHSPFIRKLHTDFR